MKLITVICTALMAFSLTACAQKQEKKKMKEEGISSLLLSIWCDQGSS